MSSVETLNLFPVSVFKTRCQNHDVIKKYMMDMVYQDFVKKGPNDKTQNTYTDYVDGATFVHWPYLHSLYEPTISLMLQQIGFKDASKVSVKLNGWYVFTTHSTACFVHDHMGGPSTIQFSAVHYVSLEEGSRGTVFMNPWAKLMKATTPSKDFKYVPDYYLNFNRCPEVSEGDIVLFPSWLDHCVPEHTNETLRITNAINIMIRLDNSDGA